jgi:hypothetical protein
MKWKTKYHSKNKKRGTLQMRILSALFLLLLVMPQVAFAQDTAGLEKRIELAKKMHELRPTRDQVDAAIEQVAASQPAAEQEPFKIAMRSALNYQAIEKISIDSMAEVYSEAELQAMIDYYSKPEAKSAAAKDPEYAKKVFPEITRMLDQAMMRVRTGGP